MKISNMHRCLYMSNVCWNNTAREREDERVREYIKLKNNNEKELEFFERQTEQVKERKKNGRENAMWINDPRYHSISIIIMEMNY